VFFFHGTPGSRLVLGADDAFARMAGVRLILPERPGYGISDPKPNRVLLDWPADVAELADQLGIDAFAVVGASGGGPHALACAYRLAPRATKAVLLASPSPAGFRGATEGMSWGNRLGLLLDRHAPWLVRRLIRSYAETLERDPDGFVDALAKPMAPSDRALFERAAFREAILRDVREAYRQGGDGQAIDAALAMTSRDWGFSLRDVAIPVHLWQGEDDTFVTSGMAQYLVREIPRCKARFVRGAGHLLTEHPAVIEEVRTVLLDP